MVRAKLASCSSSDLIRGLSRATTSSVYARKKSWVLGTSPRMTFVALLALALSFAAPAHAVQPDEILKDPVLEARARSLSAGLRCLVCQNQSIDDSDAPLARDLRLIVRERLVAGDTDAGVKAYVTTRYGEFVLLSPPFNAGTVLLWFGPFAVLALGGLLVWRQRRAASASIATASLSSEEQARLDHLLKDKRD